MKYTAVLRKDLLGSHFFHLCFLIAPLAHMDWGLTWPDTLEPLSEIFKIYFSFVQCFKAAFHLQFRKNQLCRLCWIIHPWAYITPQSSHLSLPLPYSAPPSPLVTIACSLYLWVCFLFVTFTSLLYFSILHINDNTQYLSFSFWLISLSIMPSKSIHMATHGKLCSLFLTE